MIRPSTGAIPALAVVRIGRLSVDGRPGIWTLVYLAVEAVLAAVFLGWPPPRG